MTIIIDYKVKEFIFICNIINKYFYYNKILIYNNKISSKVKRNNIKINII